MMENKRTGGLMLVVLTCTLALVAGALFGCAANAPSSSQSSTQTSASASSSSASSAQVQLADYPVVRDAKYGTINLDMPIDEFNNLGFAFGDSVNITFSNGYELRGIPYFNGYYVRVNDPVIVGYPGSTNIKIALNYGDSLWDIAGLAEGDTATVTLVEKGAFKDVQDAFNLTHSNERSDFASDEVFANFRPLKGGSLRVGSVYRSASPVANMHKRAPYVNKLMDQTGIAFVLDLSDTLDDIEKYKSESTAEGADISTFVKMQNAGLVEALGLSTSYPSHEYAEKLVAGLNSMVQHDGPYLMQCIEGRDRTGFVALLLEALCGATYNEMVDDFMVTYENYYQVTKESVPDKYEAIRFLDPDGMLAFLAHAQDGADLSQINYAPYAREYLKSGGMTDEQIDALIARIS